MQKIVIRTFIGITILMLYFQNCSYNESQVLILSSLSDTIKKEPPLPLSHPEEKNQIQTQSKVQIVNREYIMALIIDIFSDSSGDLFLPEIQSLIDKWVYNNASQYGLGCNVYTSHTGRDCPDQVESSNSSVYVDHNAVRESYQLQMCRSIFSIDSAVRWMQGKVSNGALVPDRKSIVESYNLFYRGDDPSTVVINTFLDFDRALAENKEPPLERWRGLFSQICESPMWQQF